MKDILEYVSYCPITGLISRIKTTSSRAKCGDICNKKNSLGYIVFYVNKKFILGHRLAWYAINSDIPNGMEVDHINGIKSDNRICNLRLVTDQGNARNMSISKNNKSGITGVSWCKDRNKWRATIMNNGKQISLGYFNNIDDAIKIRKQKEKEFGYHKGHGKAVRYETETLRTGGFGSTDKKEDTPIFNKPDFFRCNEII